MPDPGALDRGGTPPRAPDAVARPSDDERERAVARLSEAFAHDVLSLDEFERRMAATFRAPSADELARLTADLPLAAAPPARGAPAAMTPLALPPRLAAVLANVERGGTVTVPSRLDVRAVCGNVELDLTDAHFQQGLTEFSLRAVAGNIEIRLPAGIEIENHGGALLGSFECHVAQRGPRAATARVRITGRAILGNVEIIQGEGSR